MGRRTRPSLAQPDPPPSRDRGQGWWPIAAIGAVLALKIALALTLAPHPLLQPEGELDAGEYWRLAQRVAAGDVLLQDTPFYVSPLYIYWLAVALAITGGQVAGVLVLQAVLGTAAVWLTARTAASWVRPPAGRRAAVVAGAALALTGIVALQDALILQSALDAFLMALVALTASRALQSARPRTWFACGAAIALLATNRPNAWLLAFALGPAAMLVPARRASPAVPRVGVPAAATAWLLGLVLVLAPFAVRTAIATGEWQVLPGHGGLNLYIGNHAAATGTYTVVDGIRPSIEGQRDDMRRVTSQATGEPVSDAAASSWFVRRSLAWWRAEPVAAVRLLAWKLLLTIHPWELPANISYAWLRAHVGLLAWLPVGAWLLLPLGLATAVGGHLAVPDAHRQPWRWFRWLLPAYLASVALFFVVDRYRAPALVLAAINLGVLSAAGRTHIGAQPPTVARLAVAVALLVSVAGLVPLPFHLGEADADTRMALHAIAAGRDDEARTWLARATERSPVPGLAWLRAGLAWQARGDIAMAEQALREAHRRDPDVADVSFALAEVLVAQGKGGESVPLLEQAERAGVRPDRVRLDLALAHWQAGAEARAREVLAPGIPVEGLPLLRARALASFEARRLDVADWLLTEYRRYRRGDADVAEKLGLVKARRGEARPTPPRRCWTRPHGSTPRAPRHASTSRSYECSRAGVPTRSPCCARRCASIPRMRKPLARCASCWRSSRRGRRPRPAKSSRAARNRPWP